jgi:dihydrofolate synthase/folylpolyglutamate synthase
MNYEESIEYLLTTYGVGKKKGFAVLRKALRSVGDPQENLKIIHVAGTNGKGSVCTMVSSVLAEAGYKVGTFTSPHLVRFNERLRINGQDIPDDRFAEYMAKAKALGGFSFFETLLIMAYMYFHDEAVDYAIIETGIGGRLDATNVITKPEISVITAIGYDHMDLLGNTVEQITKQKAGIIKKNRPTVLYFPEREVYNIVRQVCDKRNSELHVCDEVSDYEINLIGEHQRKNASVAAMACGLLGISETNIREGLRKTRWAGRLEIISDNPLVILDGSHNVQGAEAFNHEIKRIMKDKTKLILVLAMLKGKDYTNVAGILTELADTVIVTETDYQSISAEVLAECCIGKNVRIEKSNEAAFNMALGIASMSDVVAVSGSLYLVGDIKKRRLWDV